VGREPLGRSADTGVHERVARAVRGRILAREPMSRHTTYGIGGPADLYVEPETLEDLKILMRFLAEQELPGFWLGAGSNLLVSDQGIRGIVVRLNRCCRAVRGEGRRLRAGAAVPLGRLLSASAEQGLGGIAFLAGIPGTLGGAVRMNAGAFGAELGDRVEEVEIVRCGGEPVTLRGEDLRFGYRRAEGLGDGVIVAACLRLDEASGDAELRERDRVLAIRRERQPGEMRSCGSVFKRVPGALTPGELIEKAGCKGLARGGAQVSRRHANFIVNLGGATAADVWWLVGEVRKRVEGMFGVRLPLEMEPVGPFPQQVPPP